MATFDSVSAYCSRRRRRRRRRRTMQSAMQRSWGTISTIYYHKESNKQHTLALVSAPHQHPYEQVLYLTRLSRYCL